MPRTSNKQEEILQYIDRFVAENGYPPSVREIGAAVGLRSTASVSYHLNHLQAKGLVAYEAGKKRALSMPNAKPGQIPIIGVVTAGLPILAVENQEGTMSWDGDPGCFALRPVNSKARPEKFSITVLPRKVMNASIAEAFP